MCCSSSSSSHKKSDKNKIKLISTSTEYQVNWGNLEKYFHSELLLAEEKKRNFCFISIKKHTSYKFFYTAKKQQICLLLNHAKGWLFLLEKWFTIVICCLCCRRRYSLFRIIHRVKTNSQNIYTHFSKNENELGWLMKLT